MLRTGFISININRNTTQYLKDITSLTISNYGNSALTVIVNGVSRTILPFNPEIGVPFGSFNIPGDGSVIDKLDIDFKFENGAGKAILDYRKPKTC